MEKNKQEEWKMNILIKVLIWGWGGGGGECMILTNNKWLDWTNFQQLYMYYNVSLIIGK